MSVHWNRVTEYDVECDECGKSEVLYSGDSYHGRIVCNITSAIYVAGFHRSRGKVLCDVCFKARKLAEKEKVRT